jgi:hypothetical protein
MNAPDFGRVLRDIGDIKAEARAHELALVDLWRADVDRAAAAVVRDSVGQLVKQSCSAIAAAEPLSDDEVVRTRNALACLSDVVADFSAEARSLSGPVPDPVDEDDDEGGACDAKQDARRDRELES